MTTYAIKDWDRLFQRSDLREDRVKVWKYVPIPINLIGECYRKLMATSIGRDAYTVFVSLCAIAANLPRRGVLENERGPLSSKAISDKTGIPTKAIDRAIAMLASDEIGWLVDADKLRVPRGVPPNGSHSSVALPPPSAAQLTPPPPPPDAADPAAEAAEGLEPDQESAFEALTASPWPSLAPTKARKLLAARGPAQAMAAIRRGQARKREGESIGGGLIVRWIESGDAAKWAEDDAERFRNASRIKWGRTPPEVQARLVADYRIEHPEEGNADDVLVESDRFLDWLPKFTARQAQAGAA